MDVCSFASVPNTSEIIRRAKQTWAGRRPTARVQDHEQTTQASGRAQAQEDMLRPPGMEKVHRRPRPDPVVREKSKTDLTGSACCLGWGHARVQVGTAKSPSVWGGSIPRLTMEREPRMPSPDHF